MSKTIEFFWDIGSTNTYFALHLIRPVADRYGARIDYRPYNLGYVFRHHNYVLQEEPRIKLSNRRRDLARWAARYELPFRVPEEFPIKTSRALRSALAMRELGREEQWLDILFSAYWERGDASIATYEGLGRLAESIGVSAEELRDRCESDALQAALAHSTNEGLERGIFGAPTFVIDGEIYWGKDRMEFIEDHLATGHPALP